MTPTSLGSAPANWFVGIPVPPGGWTSRIPRPPPGTRAFDPADLHLTIVFLGPCGEARARAAWDLARWVGPAIAVRLGAVVPMGDPRRPGALSALLARGEAEVGAIIARLRGPLAEAAGMRPDPRPPRPHLTLARIGRRATAEQRAAALRWAAALDLAAVELSLSGLALYTRAAPGQDRRFRIVQARG